MIKNKLLKFKNKFDALLKQKLQKEKENFGSEYQELVEEVARITFAGGKRLRPALVYWGYEAVGGKGFNEVVDACISSELFHTFALVHDDIMDKSRKRRGVTTTWKKMGVNAAILLGDLALCLADECFPQNVERKYWDLLKKETAFGQYLDIKKLKKLDEKAVKRILDYKTARYTVARPLQIGAFFKTKEQDKLQTLFDYGQKLGISFQIRDDLLGVFGDSSKIGKPIGDDISEGKKTLLTTELFAKKNSLGEREFEKFKKLFGSSKKLSKKENSFIINLIKRYNIDEKVIMEMQKVAKKAKKIVVESNLEKKETLIQLADFIVKREE